MRNFDSAEGTSGDGVVSTDLKIRDLIEFAYRFSEIFLPPLSVVSLLFFFFFLARNFVRQGGRGFLGRKLQHFLSFKYIEVQARQNRR